MKMSEGAMGWWGCKLAHTPGKTVWEFLKNFKAELPRDSAVALLVIYLREMRGGY